MRIHSEDMGLKFGREKFVMLVMKNEKRHMTVEMEQPNKKKFEKETNKFLGILVADTITISRDERKNLKSVSLEKKKATRNQTM